MTTQRPVCMSFVGPVNVLPSSSGIFRQGFESPSSHVLRPHDVLIQTSRETSAPARINRIVHLGWEVEVELSLKDGQEVKSDAEQINCSCNPSSEFM